MEMRLNHFLRSKRIKKVLLYLSEVQKDHLFDSSGKIWVGVNLTPMLDG